MPEPTTPTTQAEAGHAPPQEPGRSLAREVNATGWGAHGTLTITHDITRYTRARVFSRIGKQTDMLARFSTAAGETERDVRGFALKFYTEEGNWDLVGTNTPVFYISDPLKFPDYIRTQKRDKDTAMRSAAAMWDFWSRNPESLHQVTILMSERGLPRSTRVMNGYGSHTYSFYNEAGERYWVKFHFKTQQHAAPAAAPPAGYGPDLSGAIAGGDFPKWRVCVQIMPEADAARTLYNPFDVTRVWPQGDYPLLDVGMLELNRNPDDYFAEIEQAAFTPSNVVPGIGVSQDKMLQARIFSYTDAHRHRLGTHYAALAVNTPKLAPHRQPAAAASRPSAAASNAPPPAAAGALERARQPSGGDDYAQPAALFRRFDAGQRQLLFASIAASLHGVPDDITRRQLALFRKVDPAYADGVAAALAARVAQAAE